MRQGPLVLLLLFIAVARGQNSPVMRGDRVFELCEVLDSKPPTGTSIMLRGVGRQVDRGFVMSDQACSVVEAEKGKSGMMVLVKILNFALASDKRWYDRMADLMERPVVSLLIKGKVSCVRNMAVKFDGEGIPISGNGFGKSGLIRCQVENASVLGIWEPGGHRVK